VRRQEAYARENGNVRAKGRCFHCRCSVFLVCSRHWRGRPNGSPGRPASLWYYGLQERSDSIAYTAQAVANGQPSPTGQELVQPPAIHLHPMLDRVFYNESEQSLRQLKHWKHSKDSGDGKYRAKASERRRHGVAAMHCREILTGKRVSDGHLRMCILIK
jgi:hypothetical protein